MTPKQKEEKWVSHDSYFLRKNSKGTYWNKLNSIPEEITSDYNIEARQRNNRFKKDSEVLENFLMETVEIVIECSFCNTRSCESFHVTKDVARKSSWHLRMALAVLDFNLMEDINDILNDQLDLDIPGDCLQKLQDTADFCKERKSKMVKWLVKNLMHFH